MYAYLYVRDYILICLVGHEHQTCYVLHCPDHLFQACWVGKLRGALQFLSSTVKNKQFMAKGRTTRISKVWMWGWERTLPQHTDMKIERHTDIPTYILKWPRGRLSEYKHYTLWTVNIRSWVLHFAYCIMFIVCLFIRRDERLATKLLALCLAAISK